jgi:hypothetical protein
MEFDPMPMDDAIDGEGMTFLEPESDQESEPDPFNSSITINDVGSNFDTDSWYEPPADEDSNTEIATDDDAGMNIEEAIEMEIENDDMLGCIQHPHGGYVYPDPENESPEPSTTGVLRENPYHPWANADELWLCDLLFRKSQVSRSVADEILGAISSGRLSTREPIRFKNSREMYNIMDQATDMVHMRFYKICPCSDLY